jgi:hypothetical protein
VVFHNEIFEKWNRRFGEDRATQNVIYGKCVRVLVGLMDPKSQQATELLKGDQSRSYASGPLNKDSVHNSLHFLVITKPSEGK